MTLKQELMRKDKNFVAQYISFGAYIILKHILGTKIEKADRLSK